MISWHCWTDFVFPFVDNIYLMKCVFFIGKHVINLFVQYTPYKPLDGDWQDHDYRVSLFWISSCIDFFSLCYAFLCMDLFLFHLSLQLVWAAGRLMLKLIKYFMLNLFRNRLQRNASRWLMNMLRASAHQSLVMTCWLHQILKG